MAQDVKDPAPEVAAPPRSSRDTQSTNVEKEEPAELLCTICGLRACWQK